MTKLSGASPACRKARLHALPAPPLAGSPGMLVPHTRRRIARALLATMVLLLAPSLALPAEGDQVFRDWETMRGKVVAFKDPAEIPAFAWLPIPEEGRVVLYGLGVLRLAVPGTEEVEVKAGKREVDK